MLVPGRKNYKTLFDINFCNTKSQIRNGYDLLKPWFKFTPLALNEIRFFFFKTCLPIRKNMASKGR